MKKIIITLLIVFGAIQSHAQTNIAGTLYASNFAKWIVGQPSTSPQTFVWPSPTFCQVSSDGATFPAFAVGTPVKIDDADPALTEIVTPTSVIITNSGCSITAATMYRHYSYHFASATAGLQEAINYAKAQSIPALIYVTPDFVKFGGTDSTFTQVKGNSQISIQDARTSVIVPYIWDVTTQAYIAHPFSTGSGGNLDGPQQALGFYVLPGTAGTVGPSKITADIATGKNISIPGKTTSPNVNGNFYPVGLVPDGVTCSNAIGSTCTYSGTDNAAAIQAAINAAYAAGGGVVILPGGTYNIVGHAGAPRQTGSSTTNVAALTIPGSNISIQGAGRGVTVLSYWVDFGSGGIARVTDECPANPDFTPSNPYYSFPRTWRGSGIYIVGSTDPTHPTTGVSLTNFTLLGNAVINGNSFNPVRQDSTVPLPFYSQCNAWDTSNKGIYYQNNNFVTPQDGAYYPAASVYFGENEIDNVEVGGFLAELVYDGELMVNTRIRNGYFHDSNGDGISIWAGQDITDNVIENVAANGIENTYTIYPANISHNHINNVKSNGINLISQSWRYQNNAFAPATINDNTLINIVGNGMLLSDPSNMQVKHNQLTDCSWTGAFSGSSSCINLYAQLSPIPVSFGPNGPSAPTLTAGTGGSIAAGIYSVATTFATENVQVLGQTSGTCAQVTVSSSGKITINAPTDTPPAGTTGWYPYAIAGSTCDATHLPNLQIASTSAGFTPYPLSTTSITLTSIIAPGNNSPAMPWPVDSSPNGYVVYPMNPTNVDVQNNQTTANAASISNGVGGWGAPSAFNPLWARNVNLSSNKATLLSANATKAHAAPSSPPTVTAVAGPGYTYAPQPMLPAGTYYIQYTELWGACETQASPETSITTTTGQQINVSPSSVSGAPYFKVYISTTSGNEIVQDNIGNSFTNAGNVYTQQYFLRTSASGGGYTPPPTTACAGTTFNNGIGLPSNFSVASNSSHASRSTIFANESTGTGGGAVENQAVIGKVITTAGTPVPVAKFRANSQGPIQVNFQYKVSNAPTTINAYLTYLSPDAALPTFPITSNALSSGTGQAVNGAWYSVSVPDLWLTTGFEATLYVVAGTANNITVNASISSKGMIQ